MSKSKKKKAIKKFRAIVDGAFNGIQDDILLEMKVLDIKIKALAEVVTKRNERLEHLENAFEKHIEASLKNQEIANKNVDEFNAFQSAVSKDLNNLQAEQKKIKELCDGTFTENQRNHIIDKAFNNMFDR